MKSRLLDILKLICLIPIAGITLFLFLVLCYCVPLDEVNYRMSVDEFYAEGWYTDVLELRPGYEHNFFSKQPGIQPVFNDMMDYYRAAGYSDKSPVYNAMAMGYDGGDPYPRYWHGYAGILRLLLTSFDCKEIKYLSFIFQFLLVVLVAIAIRNREGNVLMLLFLTQYILLMPLAVSVCMVFAFSIDISLIGILIYTNFKERMDKNGTKWVLFCLIGLFTCFFEELVFGVLTWGITIIWIMVLFGKGKTVSTNISSVIKSGLAWIWGYGGIWVMKWFFASIVLGENVFQNGFESISFRSSSNMLGERDHTLAEKLLERYNSISENYKYYFYTVFFIVLACWVLFATYRIIRRRINYDSRIPSLGIIAVGPVVWYFVLANHTMGHRFMTYRIYNFGIIAVLALLLIATDLSSSNLNTEDKKNRGMMRRLAIVTVSAVLAIVPASLKTEEYESKNVNIPGGEVAFSECAEHMLRMKLKPAAYNIKGLGLALYPTTIDGSYEFRLLQDGELLYTIEQPMSLFADSSWQVVSLDWRVNRKQEYTFEIIPKCNEDNPGSVSVISMDASPVSDLSAIDGNNVQITYWMTYDRHMSGKKWLFYFLTWYAVFESIFLVVKNSIFLRAGRNHEADHSNSML